MGDEGRKSAWLNVIRAMWSRRKWLAILVFLACSTAVVSVAKFLPKIYRSTATVLVERQQVPEAFVRPSVTGELETRLQTVSQEILSRARLKELITRFDLYPDLRRTASMEAVVERMRRDIQLESKGVEETGGRVAPVAFTLSYWGRDPQTVAQVTNTLASFYVDENLKARERQAAGTAEFLKGQLEEMKKRMDGAERRVSDFKTRYIGELPQQVDVNKTTVERLSAQLRMNSDMQVRALDRREALAKQLAEVDSTAPDATAARIAKLTEELAELRTRFTEKYPDVIRLKAEIALLERGLVEKKADAVPQPEPSARPSVARRREALNQVEAELKALKEEEKSLRQAITTYQRRLEGAPRWEQELQTLTRDYEATKESYYSLLKRYEEAHLAENLEQRQRGEQFRILDAAVPADQPAAPNRLRLILVGLMVSLALAGAAVGLAEQLDTSFHSVDEIRAFTKVPVVASIPRIVTRTDARHRRRRFRLAAVSAFLGLWLIAGASYYLARGMELPMVLLFPRGR